MSQVSFYTVTANEVAQRIDNFLLHHLKGVPKGRIYRIIRKGEVRINKGRVKPEYKLKLNDIVRIPPIEIKEKAPQNITGEQLQVLQNALLYEDNDLIVINKPSGLGVHSGTHGIGIIEIARELKNLPYLELVHRLDKETSGLLLLAKNRPTLIALHELFKNGHAIEKHYTTLVIGEWKGGEKTVTHTLKRENDHHQKVHISNEGKKATSTFIPIKKLKNYTLLEVQIHTGRMHQIRVQLAHLGYPILNDKMYGRKNTFKKNRLFLHASKLVFNLHKKSYTFKAPLPKELKEILHTMQQ